MRLIDADALQNILLPITTALEHEYGSLGGAVSGCMKHIDNAPTVDAVPVVRCEDCKHLCVWNRKDMYAFCPKTNIVFLPFDKDTRTFFCNYGERKDEANES